MIIAPAVWSQSEPAPPTIILIRHGEKNDPTGNLSCAGFHRAMALPKAMNTKFKQFTAIYVPTVGTGKVTGHSRMFQTVTPLAVQDNLALNSKYAVKSTTELAAELMKKTGNVLVCWEHDNINDICKALGVKGKVDPWPDPDYDSIWIVTFTVSGKGKWKASLDTSGKEGIMPSQSCNF
jgi:hypothetical protein